MERTQRQIYELLDRALTSSNPSVCDALEHLLILTELAGEVHSPFSPIAQLLSKNVELNLKIQQLETALNRLQNSAKLKYRTFTTNNTWIVS